MKITFITSATVLIESKNKKILCDPWLSDGLYYGSWYHYPPLNVQLKDYNDVDAIYISHVHPDHLDESSLLHFPKNIPILISNYVQKFVSILLKRLGFLQVYEINPGIPFFLDKDFSIEIIPADFCQPKLCQKFLGCMHMQKEKGGFHIDSLSVISSRNQVIVNVNDCPFDLAKKALQYIKVNYPKIDFLLVGYSGAGPYPQCFDNLTLKEKKAKAGEKSKKFIEQAFNYINFLKPKNFMPFAGQYVLGGSFYKLNELRGVLEVEDIPKVFSNLESKLVLLNSSESFNLNTNTPSSPFNPPCPKKRAHYIQNVLKGKKFKYENDSITIESNDLLNLLTIAQKKMVERQKQVNFKTKRKLYIDIGGAKLIEIPFNHEKISSISRSKEEKPFVRIRLDKRLLYNILIRKAHWNNAEIGSHLFFYRDPDEFERGFYYFLSCLHV